MDMILVLLPTVILAVIGLTLIERMRIREQGERYQHDEFRLDPPPPRGDGDRDES